MLDLDDDMNLDYNRPGETPQSPPASTEEFEVLSWDSREVEQRLSAAHLIVRSILNRAPRRKLDQIIKRVRDSAPLIHSSDLVFNRCVIEALNLYPPEQRYPVTKLLVYGWGGKALGILLSDSEIGEEGLRGVLDGAKHIYERRPEAFCASIADAVTQTPPDVTCALLEHIGSEVVLCLPRVKYVAQALAADVQIATTVTELLSREYKDVFAALSEWHSDGLPETAFALAYKGMTQTTLRDPQDFTVPSDAPPRIRAALAAAKVVSGLDLHEVVVRREILDDETLDYLFTLIARSRVKDAVLVTLAMKARADVAKHAARAVALRAKDQRNSFDALNYLFVNLPVTQKQAMISELSGAAHPNLGEYINYVLEWEED